MWGFVFLWVVLGAVALRAEVIILDTGRLEGEIVWQTDDEIKVRTRAGEVTIPRSRVHEIRKEPTAYEMYKEKIKKVNRSEPKALYELAMWCRSRQLYAEAQTLLKRVLELDPAHQEARKALGLDRLLKPSTDWQSRIRGLLRSLESRRRRSLALRSLERIKDPEAGKVAYELLINQDGLSWRKRVALVKLLAQTRYKEATPDVVRLMLKDDSAEVVNACAEALAELDRERAVRILVPFLRKNLRSASFLLLRKEKRAVLKRRIARATLGLSKVFYPELVPELINALFVVMPGEGTGGSVPTYMTSTTESSPLGIGTGETSVFSYSSGRRAIEAETFLNERALDFLKELSGKDFGYEKTLWKEWWVEHRSQFFTFP